MIKLVSVIYKIMAISCFTVAGVTLIILANGQATIGVESPEEATTIKLLMFFIGAAVFGIGVILWRAGL